jgi:glycosyltransferase involved in cell wall biosynthesis
MGRLWPPLCRTDHSEFCLSRLRLATTEELVTKSDMNAGVRLNNSPLRSVHVIAGLNPAHGGPSYTVPRLCQALAIAGAEARLLSVAGADGCDIEPEGDGGRCFPPDWARVPVVRDLRRSSGLARALHELAPKADVIHDHGLWLMPNVDAGRAALLARKPFIVAPRGMLAPAALAFSRLKKRVIWALLQGEVVRRAACIHATSEQEHDEIRDFGLKNPIAIIPNGIDVPELENHRTAASDLGRIALSLGRIHPKKGLDRLVRAWAQVESAHPEWRLRIVGPDELGHAGELAALAAELKTERVSIEGSVAGDAKTRAYREADLFVLPTLNENFAITVAEALAAGTPVIATKGAPWHGLASEGCGWWIDHGVDPLAAALANAMVMTREALQAMGAKGRAWMVRDFSWDRVGRDMLDVYRWLALPGKPPGTVRLK